MPPARRPPRSSAPAPPSRASSTLRPISTPTPTPEQAASPPPSVPDTPPDGRRRVGSRLSWLGLAVSLLALAGVVWWASKQEPPDLPSSGSELAALVGAIALYALATVVRSERWQRLLVDEGADARRASTPTRSPASATWATTCCPRAPATRSARC